MVSLLYYPQNANAAEYGAAFCDIALDGKPFCEGCGPDCDYVTLEASPCTESICKTGTVLVDCSLRADGLYQATCINLRCGDAGVVSGNKCVQDATLDSSCVDKYDQLYGWGDNSNPLDCKCNYQVTATKDKFAKKVDGTVCTTRAGDPGTCKKGICESVPPPAQLPRRHTDRKLLHAIPGNKMRG
ncbi:MAG: hypothetical protein OIN66_18190 [Candidatus Methanoperedens sp.]|nr:hypothetical protein [Candidatus Methanoperedens sp.]